jgi:hypothetical protein
MGGEMVDMVIAHAPKPYHILAQKQDFFDIRGARETYRLAKKVYKLLGKENNIQMTEANQHHNFGAPLRNAASEFFAGELGFKFQSEPKDFKRPKAEMLRCLNVRSVLDLPNEKSVQDFIREKALAMKKMRSERKISRSELEKQLRKMLNIPEKTPVVDHRVWQYTRFDKKILFRIGIETEKDAGEVIKICQENGVLPIKAKNKVRLLPPLNITDNELIKAIQVIKKAVKVG